MNAPTPWPGLEVRHLLALRAVSEHGSFHRAAAHLDYTQSGISQQIRALEAIVGQRLIDRPGGSRPVGLTAAGEALLRHAHTVLTQLTAAQADVAAAGAGTGRPLRVGAFQSVSALVLPPLLGRLAADRPELRVELTQTTADRELYERLTSGELDLAVTMLPAPPGPFAVSALFLDPFVLMVAADSPLARRGEPVGFDELAGLPLVTAQSCRSVGDLMTQARERGVEPNVVHRSDDNGTVHGLVAAGHAVALVPRLVARAAPGRVATLAVGDRLPPRRVALASRRDREPSPAHDAFAAEVRRTCADLGLTAPRELDAVPAPA